LVLCGLRGSSELSIVETDFVDKLKTFENRSAHPAAEMCMCSAAGQQGSAG
jgi:hypothetical protein